MARILVVEDDKSINTLIVKNLELVGHACVSVFDGESALALAQYADIIVLDVGLPDTDGFSLAAELAGITDAPVLFLTARSDEQAIEQSFQAGCDYMKKPYSIKELQLRIESILSRKADNAQMNIPPFFINTSAMSLTINGKAVPLTPTEFSLFMMLIKNRGKTVRYARLYEPIWGNHGFSVSVVAQHISSLNRKLECNGIKCIKTMRGEGYCFTEQPKGTR
jgi:DNA-binding response OmpR family regulator